MLEGDVLGADLAVLGSSAEGRLVDRLLSSVGVDVRVNVCGAHGGGVVWCCGGRWESKRMSCDSLREDHGWRRRVLLDYQRS